MGKSNHLADESQLKARWGRSSNYRKNAIKGIKAKSARQAIYDDDDTLRITLAQVKPKSQKVNGQTVTVKPGSLAHRMLYKLSKFTSGFDPYPNHAHHMIPANAFINRFKSNEKAILLQIDYDVNNPNNLIFLPANDYCTRYHMLPWHQTDDFHDAYSREVKKSAKKINKKVKKAAAKAEPCKEQDIPDGLEKDLIEYEDLLWDVIVNLGQKSINEVQVPVMSSAT